ncbi:MAG: Rrf2 family transcriptional regulator [Rubrivivax sp.]|nr:Rrf2 family transcriptional regulator [Rubrivivax sp.]
MRLAEYTDYTLRVLMYCAAHAGTRVTVAELAQRHAVSKNHLMKIVNDLARRGLIETTRGRGGGLRLLADPARLRIGDVVRDCETDFRLVECFDAAGNECTLAPGCRLKHLFGTALAAFFAALDGATLADLVAPAPARGGRPPGGPSQRVTPVPVRLPPARRPRTPRIAAAVPAPTRG